jgi:hypothetical protein
MEPPRIPGRFTLAHDLEHAVSPLEVEVVDVGPKGLGDAQPVEGQQRRQGVVPG